MRRVIQVVLRVVLVLRLVFSLVHWICPSDVRIENVCGTVVSENNGNLNQLLLCTHERFLCIQF